MRLVFLGVFACASFTVAQGQLIATGDLYEFVCEHTDAAEAHKSANRFAAAVGNELKAGNPRRVLDPSVELRVYTKAGKRVFRLRWGCRIVGCQPEEADWAFDRRGTLLCGETIEAAKKAVAAEIVASQKVHELRRLNKSNIPKSFIRTSFSGVSGKYWYIEEYFAVGKK